MKYLILWLLCSSLSPAQVLENNPLKIEQVHQTILVKSDQAAKVVVSMQLPRGYRGYSDSVTVKPLNMAEAQVRNLKVTPVSEFYDKFSKKQKMSFQGNSELNFEVTFSSLPAIDKGNLDFQLQYQACTDEFCLLPQKKTFSIPYAAMGGANLSTDFFSFKDKNIFLIFLIVFIGGILTSLTPCIFPMIPITLSVLGARAAGRSKKRSFLISLIYVFGISITYSALGFLAAKTGTLFGSMLSKPPVVMGIAFIFYTMALSFFGIFEIQVPLSVQNRLNRYRFDQGLGGAFFYGLIAGLVASPCVGPILVSILAFVAQAGNPALGIGLLFTYALGMGILFIVLGTFTHVINKIPKAGPWMGMTKFIFGVSLIAVALYYIKGVFPDRVFLGFVAFSLVLVSYLHGAFDDVKKLSPRLKIRKWVMASLFLFGLALGFRVIFITNQEMKQVTQQNSLFKPYSEIQLEKALTLGQPVMIDFFADWCAACHELDKFTFSDPTIKSRLEKHLLLKVDATTETDEVSRILAKFGIVGLPTIIFYDSKGVWRKDLTLTGFESAEDFLKRLDKL